jgi:RHS repeat-associated protein
MRILQIDGYNYDAAGNVLSDPINGLNTYSYDAEGRVATANNGTIAYLYDAEGRRVAKESVSTVLTFRGPIYTTTLTNQYILGLGGEQLTELDGSGNWLHSNAYAGGKLLATYDNNGLHFHFTDWLGSRRLQASGTGLVEETCQSLPFGDGLSCTGPASDATEHHFTGKERDTESGLDYFGARYLGSIMGRWMSPDWASVPVPLPYADISNPQTLNLYGYGGNNPLSNIDMDGHLDCAGATQDVACAVTAAAKAVWNWLSSGSSSSSGGSVQTSVTTVEVDEPPIHPNIVQKFLSNFGVGLGAVGTLQNTAAGQYNIDVLGHHNNSLGKDDIFLSTTRGGFVDKIAPSAGSFAYGGYLGAGIQITAGNGTPAKIKGPFTTYSGNLAYGIEVGGFTYSYSGTLGSSNFVWQLSISPPIVGVGLGAEFSRYQTTTCNITGANAGC